MKKKYLINSKFSRLLLKLYETCHYGSNTSDGFSLGKHTWLERYTKYLLCPHIHARWSKLGQTQVKRVVFVQT